MIVKFVQYGRQYQTLKKEINETIDRVLSNGNLILQDDVRQFEENLATFIGTKYAIGLNSGTDALFLSLKAVGIKEGDEVITVSHTFIATIEAIVHCGAIPILVDVGEDMLMDMSQVQKAIMGKTKAVIPVHLAGRTCDMLPLLEMAVRDNFIIIEDAAQALGSSGNFAKAGSFGLTGCFSFYPAKILGCYGDGGAITTDDEEMADKIRLMRDHYQVRKLKLKIPTDKMEYGYNSRLDNLQAAVLNVKFKYLPEWIERRKEIARRYHLGLGEIAEIKLPPLGENDVFQEYTIQVKEREKFVDYLQKNGIEVLVGNMIPNHRQKGLGLEHFILPNTERLAREAVRLPICPELTDDEINYVIETIKKYDF